LTLELTPALSFDQAVYSIVIPTSGTSTVTVSATAYDSSGEHIPNAAIVYSIVVYRPGVNINSSTGVVTVQPTAQPGTVTIRAAFNGFEATTELTLTLTPSGPDLSFDHAVYSLAVPASGTSTVTVSATAYDEDGEVIPNTAIVYSIVGSHPGVSINSSTGVVTVQSTAQLGVVTIRAAYSGLETTVELVLTDTLGSSSSTIELTIVQNREYLVMLSAQDITSFAGMTITVTYDPAALQLVDFAAQAGGNTTTVGAVAGTPLTIVSHTGGALTFTVNTTILSGYTWSGVLTVLHFRALTSGSTEVTVQ